MSEKEKDLPEELIHQILLRLPVKSLLRFKCVCNSWLSLISNPHFAKSHFDLAAAPSHRLMLTQRFGSVVGSLDLDASFDDHRAPPLELHFIVGSLDLDASFDDHHAPSLEVNFTLPTSREPIRMILGSCGGFLLLESHSNLLLWNPSTGVHKQLPLPPVFSYLFGFGYDESRDDYLVVQGWHDQGEVDVVTQIQLFSVRANLWRKLEGTRFAYKNYARIPKAGSFLNGAIHWLVCRGDESEPVIIAFDLMERNFTEIPLPDGVYPNENSYVRVLGGCLCLTTDAFYGFPYPVEIWVMKEYKVQSSWTKPTFQTFIEDFSPVCFNKSGDLLGIGGSKGPTGLVKCNGKGEIREYANYHYGCEAAVYTESLLSLPDGSGQVGNGDQQ